VRLITSESTSFKFVLLLERDEARPLAEPAAGDDGDSIKIVEAPKPINSTPLRSKSRVTEC